MANFDDVIMGIVIFIIIMLAYFSEILPSLSNSKLFFLVIALFILILISNSKLSDFKKRVDELESKNKELKRK